MMMRYMLVFALGAVAGTAYDYIHVAYGVLSYTSPHWAETSAWVPVEFGTGGVVGAFAVGWLSRRLEAPVVGRGRVALDAGLLLLAYLLTGWLAGSNLATFAALVPVAAVAVLTRPSRLVVVGSLIAGVTGPLAETVMITIGLFRYNVAELVPYWLPLLWVCAAGLFIDLGLLVQRDVAR